jgi:hypothetical protein
MSHENTITIEADGQHYVIPTVVDGQQVNDAEAVRQFQEGKIKPFGTFKDRKEANDYARNRSDRVTDPAILAQLNGKVTDPAILKQLNGKVTDPALLAKLNSKEPELDRTWKQKIGDLDKELSTKVVEQFKGGVKKVEEGRAGGESLYKEGLNSLLVGIPSGAVSLLDRTARGAAQLFGDSKVDPDLSQSKMGSDLDTYLAKQIGLNPESPMYKGVREVAGSLFDPPLEKINQEFGAGAGLLTELATLGGGFGLSKAMTRGTKTSTPSGDMPKGLERQLKKPDISPEPEPTLPQIKFPLEEAPSDTRLALLKEPEDVSVYKNPEEYARQLELEAAARHENAETRRMVEERIASERNLEALKHRTLEEESLRKVEMAHDFNNRDQSLGKARQEEAMWKQHDADALATQVREHPSNTALAQAFKDVIDPPPLTPKEQSARAAHAFKQSGAIGDFGDKFLDKFKKEVAKANDADLGNLRDRIERVGEPFTDAQVNRALEVVLGEMKNRHRAKIEKATEAARKEFPNGMKVLYDGRWATVDGHLSGSVGIRYRDLPQARIWVMPEGLQKPLGGPGKKQGGWIENPFGALAKKEKPKGTSLQEEVFGLAADISTNEWLHREFGNVTKESIGKLKDLKHYKVHMSSASFRTTNPLIKYLAEPVYRVAHHLDQKIKESLEWAQLQKSAFKEGYKDFNHYFMPHGRGGKLRSRYEEFKADSKMILEWERDPKLWRTGEEWYPSIDKMVELGMPRHRATLWKKQFDASERMWTVLEDAVKGTRLTLPPRIPGWVPHVFKGPYSVLVYATRPDGRKEYKAEYNAYTRGAREKQYRTIEAQLKNNDEGLQLERGEPSTFGNELHDLLAGIYRARDITDANKGLSTLLQRVYESSAKGVISHALERQHPTKAGHLLERVNEDGPTFGLTNKQIKEAMQLFQHTHETIIDWAARIKFLNETWFPLEMSGFFELPKLKDAAHTYLESYLHIPNGYFKQVDIKMRDLLINAGWDPNLAHNFFEKFNTGQARYYLWGNESFYAVNMFQATISLPALFARKSFAQIHGEATFSVSKAMLDAMNDMPQIVGFRPQTHRLFDWAEDRGILDPTGQEMLDPSKMKDPIALTIERRTRFGSFLIGYHAYKQLPGLSENKVLEMAGQFSKDVSVPYERTAGAPAMFAKFPIIGRPIAMFWTYQQHMLGLFNQHRLLLMQAAETKNPKAVINSLTAMVATQSMNMALFGLAGHAFTSNWNDLASLFNRWFNLKIPTTEKYARIIDEKYNLNGQMQFGTVSKMIGYDISGSATGVGYNMPGAFFNTLQNLTMAGFLLGKWIVKDVTKKELWEEVRNQPKQIQGPLEPFIRKGIFNTSAMPDPNMKGIPRTEIDQVVRALTGLKSIEEQSFNTSERLHKLDEAQIQRELNELVQLWRERGQTPEFERRLLEHSIKYGTDPGTSIRAIINYQIEMQKTPEQRRMKGMSTPRGISRFDRYMEEREREPNR